VVYGKFAKLWRSIVIAGTKVVLAVLARAVNVDDGWLVRASRACVVGGNKLMLSVDFRPRLIVAE